MSPAARVGQHGVIAVRRPRRAAEHFPLYFYRQPKAPDLEMGALVISRPECSSATPTADKAEAVLAAGAVR